MTPDFCTKTNNPNTTCQSNCDQPGSGASGGDVQSRIIGYYEAWNYNKNCIGMSIQDIPVGSITHLHFAFGYIDPTSFDVIPMDGLPSDLFSQLTALKTQNPSLKTIVSLGGWTFTDNGTTTQHVFGNIVSSTDNRSKFITNLQSFLQNYGFDGVDFDWEYPGAGDRGGTDVDGVKYSEFLKELRRSMPSGGTQYLINVMSYDLHGVWDANDPIGNQILAHTNLTEINLALDLYWRNGIDPNKLNLGFGFYGRSFQLSDPSCSDPGCLFKGGAAPGVCTDNSGTLSYHEIMQIISTYNLEPYYDKVDAVNYVTWNSDQWVSFDDQDTFQQKIKFANTLGLGGLLIWSLDQDTAQLDALKGVIYPKTLGSIGTQADGANNSENANGGGCRVTDCGTTGCNPGEVQITTQQCHQVSLTTSYEGEGDDCGIHFERTRSFCCDPPNGKSPFLPVPLEDLFPHPPTGDNVDTEYNLKVDPTFGVSVSAAFSDDPEDGEFGFVVLESPEEIQVSLSKRDGSHWELFNCFDAASEEAQTIQMVCTDSSESSNCGKIHLGHGAVGTIVEMPKDCGPGKYAVVKPMEESLDQTLPHHLVKRGLSASTIYDLTFDYNFQRVPRDLGDTQKRVDYSNEPGYWDKVVDKAASKRKRSLEDF
ncbi:hypothetical protein MMC17_006316 [Xylographa soralifera]|nr:hypothetical protein [Xylographa soralifera]